ncbi:conserved hypothetical protein [Shouchella clausii KSM-K16]|uniref:Uncharacterized protein n=1 Tax=Shouchella clausii (strain KSM-K16) TaxID=66692 RepID=Q5WAJ3_SHOC1|nr:conserved hypothetical protein [Shouchella clausii KSM-K16]
MLFWRINVSDFYFDVHMHLDLYEDTEKIINQILNYKSYTIAVTNLPYLYDRAINKFGEQRYLRFALGLHPELLEQFPEQIPYFFERLEYCRYIGEIGLDFGKNNYKSKMLQIDTFEKIIKTCGKFENKILSVHSRKAEKEVIDIIGSHFNGKIILHWYSGNMTELSRAIRNNYYFSINGDMLASKRGRDIVNKIPLERILIESDAPFTKDTRENYNILYINNLISNLSNIKKIDKHKMSNILKGNFSRLLK